MEDFAGLVAEILRLPREKITPDLAFKQADTWDSLTHMDLVAAIEQKYDLLLSGDDIVAMTTVGRIVEVLAAHGRRVEIASSAV